MSGAIERIEAKLDQLLAIVAQGAAGNAVPAQPVTIPQPLGGVTGVGGTQPLTGLPAATGVSPSNYPPATQEQVVELVTPLVADPNIKAALQQEMHAMGIQALPDAQPHQYGELYYRFTQVRNRFAANPAPAVAAAPASII